MNVLVDYHHGNLLYSLHLLFEKRLGWKMYRPIGLDWFDHGFFKIAEPYGNAQDTINQYLDISAREWDRFKSLSGGSWKEDDVYRVPDGENNFVHRAITLDTFKKMKFDLVVSSHPLHSNWADLLVYQPEAKYIAQIGNENQNTNAENVLCSTADFKPQAGQNIINYHQEFDLDDYSYKPPQNHNKITSFVVGLPEAGTFNSYKNSLPNYDFKAYGAGLDEGSLGNAAEISKEMQDSAFGWHIKPADGYGHVIHKWYASGRPLITRKSYYEGKMASPLLIDGETCIDLDAHTFDENVQLIKYWSIPENHMRMCENAYQRFNAVVNFEAETEKIREWINNLMGS